MDQLLYENGNIRVTRNVFSNGRGEQFMLGNVAAVREERKGKPLWPLMAGMALVAASWPARVLPHGQTVCAGLGFLLAVYYFLQKDRHLIYLCNARNEFPAFKTTDESVHLDVLKCLRRALALQGR